MIITFLKIKFFKSLKQAPTKIDLYTNPILLEKISIFT
jgi:hypothetical protein